MLAGSLLRVFQRLLEVMLQNFQICIMKYQLVPLESSAHTKFVLELDPLVAGFHFSLNIGRFWKIPFDLL